MAIRTIRVAAIVLSLACLSIICCMAAPVAGSHGPTPTQHGIMTACGIMIAASSFAFFGTMRPKK